MGVIGGGAAALGLVNPPLAIIAGGLAPVISEYVADLVTKRAKAVRASLDKHQLSLETVVLPDNELGRLKMELIRESLAAALGSDYETKVNLLVRILKHGIESAAEEDVLFARRVARTVSRIDEIEIRTLWGMRSNANRSDGFALIDIREASSIKNVDMLSSALAVLAGEGLVRLSGKVEERWQLTDFGFRLLAELEGAYS